MMTRAHAAGAKDNDAMGEARARSLPHGCPVVATRLQCQASPSRGQTPYPRPVNAHRIPSTAGTRKLQNPVRRANPRLPAGCHQVQLSREWRAAPWSRSAGSNQLYPSRSSTRCTATARCWASAEYPATCAACRPARHPKRVPRSICRCIAFTTNPDLQQPNLCMVDTDQRGTDDRATYAVTAASSAFKRRVGQVSTSRACVGVDMLTHTQPAPTFRRTKPARQPSLQAWG